ncbi:MAG TPA: PGPGW domain-containing protein [Candidatus Saccharimonadales bacterium]|nr:PGPGW domain-containing protein [Candidatus Saccharimonadales bacterium]
MSRLYKRWKKIPKAVRKPLVFIVGFAVVGAGLFMLIFPGPGWAAIFVGFAILATEFAFAERVRDWMVKELKRIVKKLQVFWHRLRQKIRSKHSS